MKLFYNSEHFEMNLIKFDDIENNFRKYSYLDNKMKKKINNQKTIR